MSGDEEGISRRTALAFVAGSVSGGVGVSAPIVARSYFGKPDSSVTYSDSDGPDCPTTAPLSEISAREIPTDPREITGRGDRAIVSGVGLSVVDISNPKDMREVASLSEIGGFGHVWLDEYVYTMDLRRESIVTVDVSDLSSPEVVGEVNDPRMGTPRKASYRDGLVYVSSGDGTNTFNILDVTDREHPRWSIRLL